MPQRGRHHFYDRFVSGRLARQGKRWYTGKKWAFLARMEEFRMKMKVFAALLMAGALVYAPVAGAAETPAGGGYPKRKRVGNNPAE